MIDRKADKPDPNSTEAIGELLKELALKIDRLKTLYEQYFMGIEKIEPMVSRKDVQRAMLGLQQIYIRNTGLRFKFNTMLQKWNLYTTYWNRTLREIDKGTYIPHLQKAKRAAEREGKELPDELAVHLKSRASARTLAAATTAAPTPAPPTRPSQGRVQPKIDAGDFDLDIDQALAGLELGAPTAQRVPVVTPTAPTASPTPRQPGASPPPPPPPRPPPVPAARPAVPPPIPGARPASAPPAAAPAARSAPPPTVRPTAPPAASVPGMSEAELRALHQRYVDSRRKNGEQGEVKFESLVSSLARQVPGVLNKSGGEGVRFDVTVQGGRTVLKATPTKK